jgi:hypothetical protein
MQLLGLVTDQPIAEPPRKLFDSLEKPNADLVPAGNFK